MSTGHTAKSSCMAATICREFRLEQGLPVWTWDVNGITIEKRLLLPYRQNTVIVRYHMLKGDCNVLLELRPAMHFRPHEGVLGSMLDEPYQLRVVGDRYEFASNNTALPPLRMLVSGSEQSFTFDRRYIGEQIYYTEEVRGLRVSRSHVEPGLLQGAAHAEQPGISACVLRKH